jgi:hypothetical protein
MSQVLERERRDQLIYRAPVSRRNPVIDFTIMTLGLLAAGVGVYFQFAPDSWWLAHFTEGYHFGAYVLGAAMLATGFGIYADRTFDEDGTRSNRVTAALTVVGLAIIAAVVAVVFWVL